VASLNAAFDRIAERGSAIGSRSRTSGELLDRAHMPSIRSTIRSRRSSIESRCAEGYTGHFRMVARTQRERLRRGERTPQVA
jgi:hypothetical protein